MAEQYCLASMQAGSSQDAHPLRPGGLALTQYAVSLCHFSPGNIIIDVGCGHGQSVALLRQCGLTAFGMDIQPYTSLDFQANATQLPLQNQSIHGIMSECVVSLLPKPQEVFAHWWHICKDNAFLAIHDVYQKHESPQGLKRGLNITQLEKNLHDTGWNILHAEDCSHHLKGYVAQALWHDVCGATCTKELQQWQHCGYGLWIAQKQSHIP